MSTTGTLSLVAMTAAVALLGAGCGSNGSAAPADATTTASGSASHPAFTSTDYTYRLTMSCYCPLVGPIDVEVADGKVASATVATGQHKGEQAPAYARKTIGDLIALADDPQNHATMTWPHGATAPTKVVVAPLARAADAQVGYSISDLSAG